MIVYKTYVISRDRDAYKLWRGESSSNEDVTFGNSYEQLVAFIDLKWDGKEPEGYFQKY